MKDSVRVGGTTLLVPGLAAVFSLTVLRIGVKMYALA